MFRPPWTVAKKPMFRRFVILASGFHEGTSDKKNRIPCLLNEAVGIGSNDPLQPGERDRPIIG